MVKNYIPKQGDVVFLDFNPTKGHEQNGLRPAVVISTNVFNQNTKMVIVCPITSNEKEFPTHYRLEDTKNVHGSVLCEHIISIDYEIRNLKYVEKLSDNDFISIITLLNACIEG
ncbi:MAG: type II toxin-antitoxin system PemK/MazF family toxin [Bacilli bacterium]|nr:type II toxin-antitoxin system PemK/MazF family toxin [Bacilli bacterium]